MFKIIQLMALLFGASLLAAADDTIRSARDLAQALGNSRLAGKRFEINATLVQTPQNLRTTEFYSFCAKDASGHVSFLYSSARIPVHLAAGDQVRARGHIDSGILGYVCAYADDITVHAHGPVPPPVKLTTQEVNSGRYVDQLVSVDGTLTEVFRDEIDPHFVYAVLSDEYGATYHVFLNAPETHLAKLTKLLGTDVTMTGTCMRHYHEGGRKHVGLEVVATRYEDAVRKRRAPGDPFAVPLLHNKARHTNLVVEGDLSPKKVVGRVLAAWQGNRLLLETPDGDISEIHLKQGSRPHVGETIEAVGTPETDLYQLNLSRAIWRTASDCVVTSRPAVSVTAAFMLTDSNGNLEVKTKYSGRTIRVTGLVRALPAVENGESRLNLLCDGYDVPINFSPVPEVLSKIESGCTIEATGVCVIESECWRPQAPFPHATGFSVILRTADDIRIVRPAPWWTPTRLCIVIGLLLHALAAIFVWNRIQKKISAEKLRERTRLAIELHDSISQNLAGASMQIDAATRLVDKNRDKTVARLEITSKTLTSCREELRNCIWDLRNRTLETADLNEAIRMTLKPHVDDCTLRIRLNVPRNRFTDNTAHALLHILRELAANAVRHGKANKIRIAGAVDKGVLQFSVSDNGCGFDPEARPGISQGHFGLQGVFERLKFLGGTLTINSSPGHGTRIAASLPLSDKGRPT